MGIGVSSITQRKSFTKEYMEHAHGATLGWWNHTIEDGEDKCDPTALEEDTQATLKVLYDLATAKILPYDFSDKLSAFHTNVKKSPTNLVITWTSWIWRTICKWSSGRLPRFNPYKGATLGYSVP